MSSRLVWVIALTLGAVYPAAADELLYAYEGNVLPYDASAGWLIVHRCQWDCRDYLDDGFFVMRWVGGHQVNYHYWIAQPPEPPPPTLWVEWRFRSDDPRPPCCYGCDAKFSVKYGGVHDVVYMHGNSVVSHSGDWVVDGLDINELHTYRFESRDGVNYRISVDGLVFIDHYEDTPNGYHGLQFGGYPPCNSDYLPTIHHWDYIRYGTLVDGQTVVAVDPPAGFLHPDDYPEVDRLTVTFNEPCFLHIHEIDVELGRSGVRDVNRNGGAAKPAETCSPRCVRQTEDVGRVSPAAEAAQTWNSPYVSKVGRVPPAEETAKTESGPPEVIRVWRRDGFTPETFEIVLDQPIPMDEHTRFILNDGMAVNVIDYSYIPGDADGNGAIDLADFAVYQNCFGEPEPTGWCKAFDYDDNGTIELADYGTLSPQIMGPYE